MPREHIEYHDESEASLQDALNTLRSNGYISETKMSEAEEAIRKIKVGDRYDGVDNADTDQEVHFTVRRDERGYQVDVDDATTERTSGIDAEEN